MGLGMSFYFQNVVLFHSMCFHFQIMKGFMSVFFSFFRETNCKQKSSHSLQIALLMTDEVVNKHGKLLDLFQLSKIFNLLYFYDY